MSREYMDFAFDAESSWRRRVDDSRWVDPRNQRTVQEYPYSYSEFFLFGDRSGVKAAHDGLYSDRIWQWDHKKADACWAEHVGKIGWRNVGQKRLTAFLSAYLGKPVTVTAQAEGCNVGNGYPYWIAWFTDDAKTALATTAISVGTEAEGRSAPTTPPVKTGEG